MPYTPRARDITITYAPLEQELHYVEVIEIFTIFVYIEGLNARTLYVEQSIKCVDLRPQQLG